MNDNWRVSEKRRSRKDCAAAIVLVFNQFVHRCGEREDGEEESKSRRRRGGSGGKETIDSDELEKAQLLCRQNFIDAMMMMMMVMMTAEEEWKRGTNQSRICFQSSFVRLRSSV